MIYVEVRDGVVVNRIVFDGEMPQDWPEFETFVQNDEAQIGWGYADGVFTPPPRLDPGPVAAAPDPLDQLRALLAANPDLIARLTE
jgi:hypothetical protein